MLNIVKPVVISDVPINAKTIDGHTLYKVNTMITTYSASKLELSITVSRIERRTPYIPNWQRDH